MHVRAWASNALLLAACTAGETVETGDTATAQPDGFSVSGYVLDLDDQPVVGVFVTVSTEFCIPDRTDATGAFTVTQVTPGTKRLITYGETATNGLFGSVVFPFEAEEEFTFSEPVLAPRLDETWPLDPEATEDQVLTTSDGLVLTVTPGSLSLAPFAPEELQVARVPVEDAPPFAPPGVVLVDLFALHPIQSTLDPPAAVAFPGDTGLTEGTPVVFHSLDYLTGWLGPVATGTVDAQGRPTSDPGQGLTELTWVAVSLEDT